MIRSFPNDIISNYFNDIRNLLYKADGRNEIPPEDLFDFNVVNSIKKRVGKYTNNNSSILVLPEYSQTDIKNINLLDFDLAKGINYYNKNFIDLPLEITQKTVNIEIAFYFYLYSVIGRNNPKDSALSYLIISDYHAMQPSEFLYMMIVKKFETMVGNYQNCIKSAILHFQFDKKTKEKIILQHLISFYSDILRADDKQLSVFASVQLSKQVADVYSNILIEFLTLKLNALSPETDKYYVVAPEDKEAVRKVNKKTIYELPDNFSLTTLGVKSQALDIRQTAALFYYLRKHHATIEYTDSSYSKLVHYLSGHSAENLRKRSGFGNIIEIFRETRGGVKYSNLKNVKSLLEKIISDIDKEIKE